MALAKRVQAHGRARGRPVDPRPHLAREVLERIFRDARPAFRGRLWDGSEFALGSGGGPPTFTLVFPDRAAFRRLFLRPNTLAFGEAYAEGTFDVDGSLFDALGLANAIDGLHLGFREKLALLGRLVRI